MSNLDLHLPPTSEEIDSNDPGYPIQDYGKNSKTSKEDLDDILNLALNELENNELTAQESGTDSRADNQSSNDHKASVQASMNSLISDLQDPTIGSTLQDSLTALSGTQEGINTIDDYVGKVTGGQSQFKKNMAQQPGGLGNVDKTQGDRTVERLLRDMSHVGGSVEGMEATQMEDMGGSIMNQMMSEFEKMGEKEDYNEVIDGMMRQLLSKELMFDPMREVTKKFPEWLAKNKNQLSAEDYSRYGQQYQYFQRIVAVYETEPDNFPRLMELMQDIQEFGQPPAEIIKQLAPGLEFNEQGMPVMPAMGPQSFPTEGMPGMPMGGGGVPFPSGDAMPGPGCIIS